MPENEYIVMAETNLPPDDTGMPESMAHPEKLSFVDQLRVKVGTAREKLQGTVANYISDLRTSSGEKTARDAATKFEHKVVSKLERVREDVSALLIMEPRLKSLPYGRKAIASTKASIAEVLSSEDGALILEWGAERIMKKAEDLHNVASLEEKMADNSKFWLESEEPNAIEAAAQLAKVEITGENLDQIKQAREVVAKFVQDEESRQAKYLDLQDTYGEGAKEGDPGFREKQGASDLGALVIDLNNQINILDDEIDRLASANTNSGVERNRAEMLKNALLSADLAAVIAKQGELKNLRNGTTQRYHEAVGVAMEASGETARLAEAKELLEKYKDVIPDSSKLDRGTISGAVVAEVIDFQAGNMSSPEESGVLSYEERTKLIVEQADAEKKGPQVLLEAMGALLRDGTKDSIKRQMARVIGAFKRGSKNHEDVGEVVKTAVKLADNFDDEDLKKAMKTLAGLT